MQIKESCGNCQKSVLLCLTEHLFLAVFHALSVGAAGEGEKSVMKIELAKTAGFCFGVRRAVDTVYQQAEGEGEKPIYTYGPVSYTHLWRKR